MKNLTNTMNSLLFLGITLGTAQLNSMNPMVENSSNTNNIATSQPTVTHENHLCNQLLAQTQSNQQNVILALIDAFKEQAQNANNNTNTEQPKNIALGAEILQLMYGNKENVTLCASLCRANLSAYESQALQEWIDAYTKKETKEKATLALSNLKKSLEPTPHTLPLVIKIIVLLGFCLLLDYCYTYNIFTNLVLSSQSLNTTIPLVNDTVTTLTNTTIAAHNIENLDNVTHFVTHCHSRITLVWQLLTYYANYGIEKLLLLFLPESNKAAYLILKSNPGLGNALIRHSDNAPLLHNISSLLSNTNDTALISAMNDAFNSSTTEQCQSSQLIVNNLLTATCNNLPTNATTLGLMWENTKAQVLYLFKN